MKIIKAIGLVALITCAPISLQAAAGELLQPGQVPRPKTIKKPMRERIKNTHHYEAKRIGEKWVFWQLVRSRDHAKKHAVYPYGRAAVKNAGPIEKYSVTKFHAILQRRLKSLKFKVVKKSPSLLGTRAATQPTSTGLGLGYNPSTGYIPTSTCYNASTQLNNSLTQLSFSSSGAASSFAQQTNVSASISGNYSTAFASGSAGDVFTYGDSYSTTGASGSVFFTAYQLWTANNSFGSLNTEGSNAQAANVFSTNCGSYFVSSIPVGMLITGKASYYSSSTAASDQISNAFSASANGGGALSNFSVAVQQAYSTNTSSSSNSFSFGFQTEVLGGGEGAAAVFSQVMANNADQWLDACSSGNIGACNSFVTAANNAATNAITSFQSYYGTQPTPSDLSGLTAFPNGVAGVSGLTQTVADESVANLTQSSIKLPQYTDLFVDIKPQLQNYLNVLNQISTLYARAMYLGNNNPQYALGGLSTPNNFAGSYSPTMNPAPLFDIAGGYISPLINTFSSDISTMLSNLDTCLSSPASSVATNCEPIVSAYKSNINSAYAWYSIAQNNYALQNVIALQYTAQAQVAWSGLPPSYLQQTSFGLDVIWVQGLPVFPTLPGLLQSGVNPPSGLPGLVAFADKPYPWQWPNVSFTGPFVMMLPATPGTSSISTPIGSYQTTGFTLGEYDNYGQMGWQVGSGAGSLSYLNGCSYPTISNLCSISASNYQNLLGSISLSLSPISNFFGN